MPALRHERPQRAGRERRQIDRLQLGGDPPGDEVHQTGGFRGRESLGQQPQHEAGEIVAALAVAQPVGDERTEIDLAQLGIDRGRLEKMLLDELAELVGDAMLIALDDGGVRDRQSQWPAEQRHDRIPVGQSADRRRFGKCRDEAERRMQRQQQFRRHEQGQRGGQHQRRQRLDAPQLGRARRVSRSIEGECVGRDHDGFRDELQDRSSRASRPLRRVSGWSDAHGFRWRKCASSP